jgi:hypothetical protein
MAFHHLTPAVPTGGTTTNPVYIPLDLKPGKHVLKIAIPLGKSEGTSFSAWNISGCLVDEY